MTAAPAPSAPSPPPPPPRLVFWETTAACNLRCAHCRRLDVLDRPDRDELTTDEARAFVRDLAGMGAGVLVFSGGEPLLRGDLFSLIGEAVAGGISPAVATNGTGVDAAIAARLAAAGVRRVSVSLDGASAETHEALRGPGTFAAALEGLRRLKAAGLSTQVNATVTRKNLHEIDLLHALAREIGAEALHVFLLVPVGCGAEIPDDVRLTAAETEGVLERLADLLAGGGLFVKATCAPHFHRIVLGRGIRPPDSGRHGGLSTFTKGCLAGTGIAFVSHRGEIFPCGYLPVSAGSIRTRPFSELWASSPVWPAFRGDPLTGRCGACEFQKVCMGCRARSWAATGDLLGEDPSCPHVPRRLARG